MNTHTLHFVLILCPMAWTTPDNRHLLLLLREQPPDAFSPQSGPSRIMFSLRSTNARPAHGTTGNSENEQPGAACVVHGCAEASAIMAGRAAGWVNSVPCIQVQRITGRSVENPDVGKREPDARQGHIPQVFSRSQYLHWNLSRPARRNQPKSFCQCEFTGCLQSRYQYCLN